MSGRRQINWAALALVLPFLLLAQCTSLVAVLCVAGDRHIQIELMGGVCCEPPAPESMSTCAAAHDCGDCTDLSISLDSVSDSARRDGLFAGLTGAAAAPPDALVSPQADGSGRPSIAPFPPLAPLPARPQLRC